MASNTLNYELNMPSVLIDRHYWQNYDLTRDPFADTAENAFFLLPEWDDHVDKLHHLCSYSNALLTVSGAEQSGKSTFLDYFASQVNDDFAVYHIDAYAEMTAEDLLQEIKHGFGISSDSNDSSDITSALKEQLHIINESQHECVLLIDDAENLKPELIQHLVTMLQSQQHDQVHFHVVLFASQSLQDELESTSAHSDWIFNIDLEPLDYAEMRNYIKHCLLSAGLRKAFPFSEIELQRIHKLSYGALGKINQYARQGLVEKLMDDDVEESKWGQYRSQLLIGLTAIFAAVGFIYLVQHHSVDSHHKASHQKEIALSVPREKETEMEQEAEAVADATMEKSDVNSQVNRQDAKQGEHVQTAMSGSEKNFDAEDKQSTISDSEDKQSHISMKVQAKMRELEEYEAVQRLHTKQKIIKMQGVNTVSRKKAPSHTTAVSHNHKLIPFVVKNSKMLLPLRRGVVQHTVYKQVNHKKKRHHVSHQAVQAKYASGEKSILATNKHDYAIQLLGTSQKKSLIDFVNRYHLQEKTHYYTTTRNGVQWYVLVYGHYATRDRAHDAVKWLPYSLRRMQPWVRSYSSMQEAIHSKKG